jgi:hypothetical protein
MGKRFAVASATRGRSATWIGSIALVVMVLGAAWLAAPPQAADAGHPRNSGAFGPGAPRGTKDCGDRTAGKYLYFDLTAYKMGCEHARRVADHHFRTGDRHGNGGDRRFDGWTCDDHKRERGFRVTCRHRKGENERVTYTWGY